MLNWAHQLTGPLEVDRQKQQGMQQQQDFKLKIKKAPALKWQYTKQEVFVTYDNTVNNLLIIP